MAKRKRFYVRRDDLGTPVGNVTRYEIWDREEDFWVAEGILARKYAFIMCRALNEEAKVTYKNHGSKF